MRARPVVTARVKQQRRVYAGAVLDSLARTYRGRSTTLIDQVLRQCLPPLGVRLSRAASLRLAADIAAGRPVALS